MIRDPCLLSFKKKLQQQDLSQATIYGYLDDLNYFLHWLKNLYVTAHFRKHPGFQLAI